MKDKLKLYLDEVFASAAPTRRNEELKEEMLADLYDKYDAFIADGISPEEAYRKSVDGLGDVSSLFEHIEVCKKTESEKKESEVKKKRVTLEGEHQRESFKLIRTLLLAGAVLLYILSVVPNMFLRSSAAPVLMFFMIALGTGMILCRPIFSMHTVSEETSKEERARLLRDHTLATLILAGAVMGYILCVCPPILFSNEAVGASGMFFIIALSTVAIILRSSVFGASLSKLGNEDEVKAEKDMRDKTEDKKTKESESESKGKTRVDKIFSAISGFYWLAVLLVYFGVSYLTERWESTWIIFICALLIQGIAQSIYKLVTRKGTAGPIVWIVICSVILFSVIPSRFVSFENGLSFLSINLKTYNDSSYEYGDADIPASDELDTLSIHWEDGNVSVSSWEGDRIEIRETYGSEKKAVENKEDQLRYLQNDGSLTVREYSPRLVIFNSSDMAKELTVLVPKSLTLRELNIYAVSVEIEVSGILGLEELNVESVSGSVSVSECEAKSVELENVSGRLNVRACDVQEAYVENVSGAIRVEGCKLDKADIETVSGGIYVLLTSEIESMDIETVSGSAELEIFEDIEGFEVRYDSLSGAFRTEFDTTRSGSVYRFGSKGGAEIDFNSVSGSLAVNKAS